MNKEKKRRKAVLRRLAWAASPPLMRWLSFYTRGAETLRPRYFEDLKVIKEGTGVEMTVSEVMDIIHRQPDVHTVTVKCDPPRAFSIFKLAYPQYRYRYTLTVGEWKALQKKCKKLLTEGIASEEVMEHWQSIVSGEPPFGLIVRDGD